MNALRILVIEDEASVRFVVSELVRGWGHSVEEAETGEEALQAVEKTDFDLILMDLHLPDMQGFSLLEKIRALPGKGEVPVVAITASVNREVAGSFRAAGFHRVFSKPVDIDALAGVLQEFQDQPPSSADGERIAPDERGLPLVDEAYLVQLGKDLGEERLVKGLNITCRSIRTILNEVESAWKKNDWIRLARFSHKLKGEAGSFGFRQLHRRGARLERAAEEKNAREARENFEGLAPLFQQTIEAIPPGWRETP